MPWTIYQLVSKTKLFFVLYFKNISTYTILLLDQALENYFFVLLSDAEELKLHIAIV